MLSFDNDYSLTLCRCYDCQETEVVFFTKLKRNSLLHRLFKRLCRLKFGRKFAAILAASPVFGFLPILAFLLSNITNNQLLPLEIMFLQIENLCIGQ
jgi:hypothetical protein